MTIAPTTTAAAAAEDTIAVPRAEFARLSDLADDFAQGLRAIVTGADFLPQADTVTLDGITTAARHLKTSDVLLAETTIPIFGTIPATPDAQPETDTKTTYRSKEEITACAERTYQRIDATGAHGITVLDLVTPDTTFVQARYAVRTLHEDGRIFRTGSGPHRYYTDANRTRVINAFRRRVPNHDLTTTEAATVLDLSPQRVRALVDSEELQGRRVGKAVTVYRNSVLDYIRNIGTPTP
ncbi:hypothetical protein GCM10010404_80920 [Nonomuraea africana]|uniref:Helix-turn-helix domain-containing protein n=1 Tax=Nonomuraea africana TaxID=46171 RepID=A0ABR9KXN4_9ACTN|nr:helix-turn-helix domain-containing protein [Nonomuraea africana]MBE1566531.1 hypothetical protein [Nonomuraea africana]